MIATVFFVLALTSGGRSFRWFGDNVRDVSHDIGEVADLFNQATEDIKSASQTIKKTGGRIIDMAEETGEKASDIVNTTEAVVGDIKNAVSEVGFGEKDKAEQKPISKSEKKRKRTATKNAKD